MASHEGSNAGSSLLLPSPPTSPPPSPTYVYAPAWGDLLVLKIKPVGVCLLTQSCKSGCLRSTLAPCTSSVKGGGVKEGSTTKACLLACLGKPALLGTSCMYWYNSKSITYLSYLSSHNGQHQAVNYESRYGKKISATLNFGIPPHHE